MVEWYIHLKYCFDKRLPYIHQHVCIGTMFNCQVNITLNTSKVVFNCFLFATAGYNIVVKFTPLKKKIVLTSPLGFIHKKHFNDFSLTNDW